MTKQWPTKQTVYVDKYTTIVMMKVRKTMKNELSNLEFKVDYKPSKITIENEGRLKELVDSTTDYYKSLVFTEDNITEAKNSRAELNKIAKQLDDERKKVKSGFTTPLDNFENKMNGYKKQIKDVSEDIGSKLNEFEYEQRRQRMITVKNFIEEEAGDYGLELDQIPFNESWTNKGAFTQKGNLTKGTKEDIEQAVEEQAKEIQRIADEKAMVEEFANMAELEPYGWSAMIDKGLTSSEVIAQIKKAIEQRKEEQAAAERRQKEQEQLARQVEEQQQQQTTTKQEEPQEAKQEMQTAVKEVKEEPEMEFTLHIRGKKSALFALNKYMIENDIEFRKVD
ncbi:DUF1351 domain-containing protein [Tetragenococcus halophilus]|uniref:DUF1351 domain-containing protein n=1 Tax=Tetragenococcus halophilus TaxID=51669 RepID=UPI0030DCBDC1